MRRSPIGGSFRCSLRKPAHIAIDAEPYMTRLGDNCSDRAEPHCTDETASEPCCLDGTEGPEGFAECLHWP